MRAARTFELHLQTYVRGLFVIQPKHDLEQFSSLITASGAYHSELCEIYRRDYEQLHCKGACVFRDHETPWLIIIFQTEIRAILSTALHEIVHLADRLTSEPENRARFIEHVYMTFADEMQRATA